MAKAFASQADLADKQETFVELAPDAFALTAEGDPNTGIVVGDAGAMVIDTRATPVMARALIDRLRAVTDRPVTHILLTHYHAVRVLGASAYGAHTVIASQGTHDLIRERGQQDYESEVQRFPRLFRAVETVPGLTWPTVVFQRELTVDLGGREVRIAHLGRGHTKGDTIAWLPDEKLVFAGDLVEAETTPYCGDAFFADWPQTLERLAALGPAMLVPGRGEALTSADQAGQAIAGTRGFLTTLMDLVRDGVAAGRALGAVYRDVYRALQPRYGHWPIFDHCLPFDVSRAYDEASGIADPRIWTAARDLEMWRALES